MKEVRASTGQSQRVFSDGIGMFHQSWQKYEDGNALAGFRALRALYDKGYNINYILSGEGRLHLSDQMDSKGNIELLSKIIITVETNLENQEMEIERKRSLLPFFILMPSKKEKLIKRKSAN